MTAFRLCPLALLFVLAACSTPGPMPGSSGSSGSSGSPGSVPPAVSGGDARPSAPRPGAPPSPLAGEQRFLNGWFGGTPVVIGLQDNGVLDVDVPLLHAFNAGLATPKPALVAVLDRVGESLRRQSQARVTVAAPGDGPGNVALAQARAQRVRELLVARHVAATRISVLPGAAGANFVQMRIALPATPIGRLDDAALPVPAGGVRPTSTARPASAPR
ncbi:MAG TPA: hypothetical protein VFQ20_14085 [Burkholderiaceae bacterium]|nr:hypothetical protein [Burkholderiaceae bacterium]